MAETLPLALRAPIPWPRTRLLGRQAELAAARAALLNDAAPLLTLVGPGGVGKTRLALAIAAATESAFAHGVVWVDLAPVTDPALVPMALAVALDILPSADLPLMEALSRHLRSRQILLLLDNCEHLLAPVAALVSTLLAACPAVQSLATSRAPLRVRGEREFSVEPLPLPPPSTDDLEHLARNEAVALFVDRARAVRPAFTLTEANAPVVAELCRRLDGLPLAIEIAAARGRILSPEALLAQMTDRLRLLSGGHRDLPARQQTIEATIAWSYALLDDGPRDLFQRLAVFTDGCDLEAATAVAGGEPLDVLEALSALRDQGLLRTTEQPPHGNRYTMLEMVREYALARLEARDDAGTLRTAHAAHFLALAERANEAFRGPEMATWLNRLDADYANLLAALGWLRERGDAEQVWQLVGALWRYWMLRARFAEGRQRVEEALTLPEIAGSVALARARLALAYFLVQTGDELARARELLDAALAVYREVGDQRGQASALEELMAVELNVGDLGRARARGEESLALYQALGDDYGSFNALWILAIVSMKMGDFALAHAELDRATRLAGALSPAFPRYLLRARGWLAVAEGDSRHAVCVFEEALAQARQIEFEPAMASLFDDLGWLAVWQRNWKRASNGFAEEVALGAKLSDDWHIARGMLGLAVVCADTGRPARAAWLFGAAESTTRVDVIDDDIYNPIRATYERAVALTRSALEAAAFDEGWQTGRALPRRQAIIRALSDAGGRDVSPEDAPADAVASYERLTRREAEVLRLVAQRQTDGEIADALYISRRTASSHVARILGKLGAANRREAGVVAASLGLI